MEPLAITFVAALALFLLFRRPGVLSPALVAEGGARWQGRPAPDDEDEQQPETDRAPRRWLPVCVAAVAALRLALLLTLHA